MNKKKRNKKKASALFARSKIFNFFMMISSFLYDKVESSFFGRLLSSYNESPSKEGLISNFFKRIRLDELVLRPLKRNTSKYVSRSLLLNKLSGFLSGFIFTKLSVYGVLFATTGIGFLLVSVLKMYINKMSAFSFVDTFISLALVLVSIPLLFSSLSLNSAIASSLWSSKLLFDFLGCKKETFEKENEKTGHTSIALPFAIIFCVCSWWIRPVYIVALCILFILGLTIFYTPESGIVLLICTLPFLKFEILSVFVLYILSCFLLKYVRGKRLIKFDFLSLFVLFFAITFSFGYLLSYMKEYARHSTLQMLYAVVVFFLIVNLIKSRKWLKRCIKAVCIACVFCSLYGILCFVSANFDTPYIKEVLHNGTLNSVISFFSYRSHLSEFLILVLPFVFVNVISEDKKQKFSHLVAFVLGFGCLCCFYNLKMTICLLMALSFVLMMYSKKSLAFYFIILSFVPIFYIVLRPYIVGEDLILNKIIDIIAANINSLSDIFRSSHILCGTALGTSERIYSENVSVFNRITMETGIIGLIWFLGLLFLFARKNITLYKKGCSNFGKLNSLSLVGAVVSILLLGINTNIFEDYRVVFMFWICIALSSCISSSEKNVELTDEYDM